MSARRAVLRRRIRLFAVMTITYNVIEAVVALGAGGVADSSALIGFGLDSVIEVASAVALSWQFSAENPERREHLTRGSLLCPFSLWPRSSPLMPSEP